MLVQWLATLQLLVLALFPCPVKLTSIYSFPAGQSSQKEKCGEKPSMTACGPLGKGNLWNSSFII